MQLDHVIIATTDPARSARTLAEHTGLAAVEGGVHDGLGTHNYLVPLGLGYLELASVRDHAMAAANPFGRLILAALGDRDEALAGWAVKVTSAELHDHAARSGLPVGTLARRGVAIEHTGMTIAVDSPGLPFLLARPSDNVDPARLPAAHRVEPRGVEGLLIDETDGDLERWLGAELTSQRAALPVQAGGTGRGLARVEIATITGTLTLTAAAPTGLVPR